MKTLTQYREDLVALREKSAQVDAKATNENRDLNEQEIAYKSEVQDRIDAIYKIVSTMERDSAQAALLEKPEEPKTVEKNKKMNIEAFEEKGKRDRFSSLGEQISAIMQAGSPGGKTDPRLYNATGLNETTPSDGGFLVQTDFSQELIKQVWETAKIARLCRKVTISGNANSTVINGLDETSRATGSRYGGIRGYWAAEAGEKTASKPKFRNIELNLKKLIGLCYATDEVLADASQLEGIIREGFVSEFGFLLDDAIINGTGAGQPLGILNSGCLVTTAQETSQGAKTIVPLNVLKMWSSLFADSRQSAVWLINQELEPYLHSMRWTDSNSIWPVYLPPGGFSGSPYGTLFGRPVIPCEQCQAPDTKGDFYLGDFSNGYILAEKGGIQSDMSIHVRFVYDESLFRFVMRVDGQPVRASALSPYKGTASSLSHFVVLAGSRS